MKREFKDFDDLNKWCKVQMAKTDRCLLTGVMMIALGLSLSVINHVVGMLTCILALGVIIYGGVIQSNVKNALTDWEERNV